MKRILLDTNFYAAFKRNDPSSTGLLRRATFIGINAIVLGEILSGFRLGTKETQNRKELELFLNSPRVRTLPVDEETAEFYAKIFQDLKNKGMPIPVNDMWIAASAMQHGLFLATYDDHFRHVDGILTFSFGR